MSLGSQHAAAEHAFLRAEKRASVVRDEPLHVCHIDSGDLWAGAEANTTTLLKALVGKSELWLSVILLNEGEMARRLRSYGIRVKVIPESECTFWEIFNRAARFLSSQPVHILHSHRYKENLLAALLARRCRVPHLVCTRHGAPEPFRGWRYFKHRAIGHLDDRVARHFADRVITLTEEMGRHLSCRLPAGKVVTIRTGIDTEHVRSELTKSEAKDQLGIPVHAKVVGYAGRLVPVKRLDTFLQTAAHIAKTDSDVVFVITGDGPEGPRLKALAQELRLNQRVRFLGFREHIYDVMRAFDVLLLCSDHEGLPRIILEALHLNVPIVARAVGGIPEVLVDGLTGVLLHSTDPLAFAEACRSLLRDERRMREMTAAGQCEVWRSFSPERTASEMLEVYRGLGGGK